MMAREKFSGSQWKRAFAKYSKLGYPSDDDSDEDEVGEHLELPIERSRNDFSIDVLNDDQKDQKRSETPSHQSGKLPDERLLREKEFLPEQTLIPNSDSVI